MDAMKALKLPRSLSLSFPGAVLEPLNFIFLDGLEVDFIDGAEVKPSISLSSSPSHSEAFSATADFVSLDGPEVGSGDIAEGRERSTVARDEGRGNDDVEKDSGA